MGLLQSLSVGPEPAMMSVAGKGPSPSGRTNEPSRPLSVTIVSRIAAIEPDVAPNNVVTAMPNTTVRRLKGRVSGVASVWLIASHFNIFLSWVFACTQADRDGR